MERLSELTRQIAGERPGHEFVKAAWLTARHPRNLGAAAAEAPRFALTSPNLERMMKAAVSAGGAGSGEWGMEVADFSRNAREWVALSNAETVLGRLDCVRVPFKTRVIVETDPASAGFVAAGVAIPLAQLSLDATTALERLKIGTICAFTNELLEVWGPGTQANVDERLRLAVQRGLDAALLDPERAAANGVRPGSLLNGISPLGDFTNTAAGALTDIEALLGALVDAGSDLRRVRLVTHPRTALTLSLMQNTNGNATFPNLTAVGGAIAGVPVLTSVSAVRAGSPTETIVAAIDASRIVLADDGDVVLDASRIAAVEMSSAPSGDSVGTHSSPTEPTAANLTSAFQTHTTLLKVVRWINWERADDSAVAWMTSTF
jgi:Phage capsid family